MDIINKDYIEERLPRQIIKEAVVFDKIDSTSDFARNAENGTVIFANEQTQGRGRCGKSFLSKKGGLYFSLAMDKSIDEKNLTAKTAVAVAQAIEDAIGESVEIKWVNDIYYKNKKVAGILAENLSNKIIIGIGINVYPINFSQFGLNATSLLKTSNENFSRAELAVNIIKKLESILLSQTKDYLQIYRNKSAILGKRVQYVKNQTQYSGIAQSISDSCELEVALENGQIDVLGSGEVSIIF